MPRMNGHQPSQSGIRQRAFCGSASQEPFDRGDAVGMTVRLTASDGHSFDAYRADVALPLKGSVIVLQEAFGVNAHIHGVCDDYARRGYHALAPALYDRQRRDAAFGYDETAMEQARELRRGLDYAKALLDIETAIAGLRPHGGVAVVGYCVGGSAAWLAACRLKVDAAACYYASDIGKQLDEQPQCPVIMHFAERDRFIPMETVAQFRSLHPGISAYVYPADHGFNCSDRDHGYDPPSAKLALQRTLALFEENVAGR
jgi:carboxymethylenebutenolidase